jgi:hypothetical protein
MPVGLSKMILQLSAIHRSKDILEIIEHWNPSNSSETTND